MANVRRYFRYDVTVPIYFEPVDHDAYATREQLLPVREQLKLNGLNAKLDGLLGGIFSTEVTSASLQVFYTLNVRINHFAWLLGDLLEAKDPRKRADYNFRQREDRKHLTPKMRENSKIGPLIEGLFLHVSEHIAELVETINQSVGGKIFLYPRKNRPLFTAQEYVKNLPQLAQQGVVPAQILILLIEKLNLYETVFFRLKQAYKHISDDRLWQKQSINLSAGGFGFLTNQVYEVFSELNVFMMIEGERIICRGKIVMVRKLTDGDFIFRVAIEFGLLSHVDAQKITLFVQKTELIEAMEIVDQEYINTAFKA